MSRLSSQEKRKAARREDPLGPHADLRIGFVRRGIERALLELRLAAEDARLGSHDDLAKAVNVAVRKAEKAMRIAGELLNGGGK